MMTLNQVKEAYDVGPHGTITSPGKFEGECPVVVALWNLAMESGEDELIDDGDIPVSVFVIDDDLRKEFPETEGSYAVALYESDQGFVNSIWYSSKEELDAARKRVEDNPSPDEDSI